MEKVLFPVAVHFKGSGFYSTDYGRGSRKAAAKDGDSSSTDSAAGKKEPSAPSGPETGSKASDSSD